MGALGRILCAVGLVCSLGSTSLCAATAQSDYDSPGDDPQVTAASSSLVSDSQASAAATNTPVVGEVCGVECEDPANYCNQPAWIVSAGAVFLHRSRPTPAAIATPSAGPGTLISGSDFGFNWNSGPIVSIARRTKSGYILEGRYFNDRSANSTFNVDNVTTFRMAGIGITILGGGNIACNYNTQLDSTEFNIHKPINDRCTLLGGFRCVELHDRLQVNIANVVNTTWNDNNRLYGAQTGLNMNLFDAGKPLQFTGSLKAGVFGDTAYNQFTSQIVAGTNSSATTAAFVGELNFSASYQLTRRWSLRGGYMVLWVNSLALADQAAANTRQVAGGTSSPTTTNGALWYNGALVSLDYVW